MNEKIGRELQRAGWVQTERKAHEVWAKFTLQKPTASALMHYMCAYMGDQNALVISRCAGQAPGRLNAHRCNRHL